MKIHFYAKLKKNYVSVIYAFLTLINVSFKLQMLKSGIHLYFLSSHFFNKKF